MIHDKSVTVLIVEDTESIRHVLAEKARHYGFEVVEVENGDEALRLLESDRHFDLVISDNQMPNGTLSGVQLLKIMRKLPHRKFTHFTLHTGGLQSCERAELVFHRAKLIYKPARAEDVFALAMSGL